VCGCASRYAGFGAIRPGSAIGPRSRSRTALAEPKTRLTFNQDPVRPAAHRAPTVAAPRSVPYNRTRTAWGDALSLPLGRNSIDTLSF
jgi:hypothetical protein